MDTGPNRGEDTEATAFQVSDHGHAVVVTNHTQYGVAHPANVSAPAVDAAAPLADAAVHAAEPLALFRAWLLAAQTIFRCPEPEAVCLSTVSAAGIPSSRMVLMKRADDLGFCIFTNIQSRKAMEIDARHGLVSLTFYWHACHRQVRVVGRAQRLDRESVQSYFKSRPIGSQIGAYVSRQSTVISGRDVLVATKKRIETELADKIASGTPLDAPSYWGGYRIVPVEIEFWQGGLDRLHDRFRFTRGIKIKSTNTIMDIESIAQSDEHRHLLDSDWTVPHFFGPWSVNRLSP